MNLPGEIAAIWARLYIGRYDEAMEMAAMLTTEEQRANALEEMKQDDFLDGEDEE